MPVQWRLHGSKMHYTESRVVSELSLSVIPSGNAFFLLCSAGSDANWSDPHSPCYECNDLSFKYILKHASHSSWSVSAAAYFCA